jgi:hypothetical protein
MNIYQCEERAKEIGFDKAKFVALFPSGPKECKWLDAYMGLFVIDEEGLRDGFVMTRDIDRQFPDLYCSEPYIPDAT